MLSSAIYIVLCDAICMITIPLVTGWKLIGWGIRWCDDSGGDSEGRVWVYVTM